ncbi:hypothetical protein MPSEU_000817600 [Mayamaea pseudoterrestris]|nr:hypothetical protein MPSEU_000817600 [Mayamaea pseudoterrestris]
MASIITQAISNAIVSPIVECVDVDGVVRRVNVEDVLERIDVNALVDRIDINRLLERIDWNHLLNDKIDVNTIVAKVDVNRMLMQTDMGSIVAHSTTGMATEVLDALRSQVIVLDLWIMKGVGWCTCRRRWNYLPPVYDRTAAALGNGNGENESEVPSGRVRKAMAVQERYCGILSKAIAMLIDVMFVTFSFACLAVLADQCWSILTGERQPSVDNGGVWAGGLYGLYWFLYFFLCTVLVSKTLGMNIVGLKIVVDRRSSSRVAARTEEDDDNVNVPFGRALLRTLLLPLTSVVMPLLGLIGIIRRDGRMLHDWVAGTGIIYKWDAHMAHFRSKSSNFKRRRLNGGSENNIRTPLLEGVDFGAEQREQDASPTEYATFRSNVRESSEYENVV